MKLKSMMLIAGILAGIFGLCLIFIPGLFLSFFGITLDAAGTLFARLFGGEMIGFAVLSWFARNVGAADAQRAIVIAYIARYTVCFVIVLLGMLQGLANAAGWSIVALFFLLALGFVFFLPRKSAEA